MLLSTVGGKRCRAQSGLYALSQDAPDQLLIGRIRYIMDKGLPTGNDRLRREPEQVLTVKSANDPRGRPGKAQIGNVSGPYSKGLAATGWPGAEKDSGRIESRHQE